MWQLSEGLIVIMAIILAFGLLSLPERGKEINTRARKEDGSTSKEINSPSDYNSIQTASLQAANGSGQKLVTPESARARKKAT